VVLLLATGALLVRSLGGESPGAASRARVVADALTGEIFHDYPVPDGEGFPWKSPKTGDRTIYPAEACFWTKDGKAKLQPTWVSLKQHAGSSEKTICPDCGREVVFHNPRPPPELLDEALLQARSKKK
jgi:hypothetical protein